MIRSIAPRIIAAGDAIRFCRGGAWDVVAGTRWVNSACTAENPCTVGDYAPAWGSGNESRPIVSRVDGAHGFALEDGGAAEHEEGYVFENLDLRGSGTESGWGFFLYNDIDDVLIRNLEISDFAIGVHLGGSNNCNPGDPECDGRNEPITLHGSTVRDNSAQGWLGASSGTKVLWNDFENNGSTAVFDHNIYISGSSGGQTHGIRVVGNRLNRSALDEQGVCRGVSLVVHGEHDDLRIERNEIWEDIGLAGGGCWGIAVDNGYGSAEGFTNIVVARNRVRNNSIWIGADSGGTAISVRDMGDDHIVVGNAIHYAGTSSSFNCLRVDLPLGADEWPHNGAVFGDDLDAGDLSAWMFIW